MTPAQARRRAIFAGVAPRLELAHRQERERLELERGQRDAARENLLRATWLVEHRDLQYLRACAKRGPSAQRYAARRLEKLRGARDELEDARQRARELGVD